MKIAYISISYSLSCIIQIRNWYENCIYDNEKSLYDPVWHEIVLSKLLCLHYPEATFGSEQRLQYNLIGIYRD